MNAHEKVALIMRANKGLGLEIARQLAQKGCTVLLRAHDRTISTERVLKKSHQQDNHCSIDAAQALRGAITTQ